MLQEGYSKKILVNRKDIGDEKTLLQEVTIKAGNKVKEHYHKKQTEIFYFLNNNGYWIINGQKKSFEKGDVLILEPFDKHIVVNNTKSDYILLTFKINYEDDDLYWSRES